MASAIARSRPSSNHPGWLLFLLAPLSTAGKSDPACYAPTSVLENVFPADIAIASPASLADHCWQQSQSSDQHCSSPDSAPPWLCRTARHPRSTVPNPAHTVHIPDAVAQLFVCWRSPADIVPPAHTRNPADRRHPHIADRAQPPAPARAPWRPHLPAAVLPPALYPLHKPPTGNAVPDLSAQPTSRVEYTAQRFRSLCCRYTDTPEPGSLRDSADRFAAPLSALPLLAGDNRASARADPRPRHSRSKYRPC